MYRLIVRWMWFAGRLGLQGTSCGRQDTAWLRGWGRWQMAGLARRHPIATTKAPKHEKYDARRQHACTRRIISAGFSIGNYPNTVGHENDASDGKACHEHVECMGPWARHTRRTQRR